MCRQAQVNPCLILAWYIWLELANTRVRIIALLQSICNVPHILRGRVGKHAWQLLLTDAIRSWEAATSNRLIMQYKHIKQPSQAHWKTCLWQHFCKIILSYWCGQQIVFIDMFTVHTQGVNRSVIIHFNS